MKRTIMILAVALAAAFAFVLPEIEEIPAVDDPVAEAETGGSITARQTLQSLRFPQAQAALTQGQYDKVVECCWLKKNGYCTTPKICQGNPEAYCVSSYLAEHWQDPDGKVPCSILKQ